MANFHSLWEGHAKAIHRFALYLTGRWDEAEEITAETFLRAWTAAGPIREGTARSYLIAIARNLAVDEGRRRRRQTAVDPNWPSADASPERKLECELVMEAIGRLPASLAEPLTMYAVGGLSYEETAAALGVTLSTVKIRIHRARLRLAEQLDRKRSNER